MLRRSVLLALAAACTSTSAQGLEFAIETAGERIVDSLPDGQLYWRIETFESVNNAQAAAAPTSITATISDRHWLATLGAQGARTAGANFVAEIGPIPRIEARRYLLRLNHAYAPPGAETPVHTHPGSEAFYVMTGQLTQRTTHGLARVNPGETRNGDMPGMVMQLQSTGAAPLDQLVLFVVDADLPFSSPAHFSD